MASMTMTSNDIDLHDTDFQNSDHNDNDVHIDNHCDNDLRDNGSPHNDNINNAIKRIPPTVTFPTGRKWHVLQVAGKRNTKEQEDFLTWLR